MGKGSREAVIKALNYKEFTMETKINFTKIKHDSNGNPRYVCHYFNLLTQAEIYNFEPGRYNTAVKRANKIGGRKYHTKSYGGGIVFQSYNLSDTERDILRIVAEESGNG